MLKKLSPKNEARRKEHLARIPPPPPLPENFSIRIVPLTEEMRERVKKMIEEM